jgi:hypothetical protein
LLARVSAEELFIKSAADLAHHHVFGRADLRDGFRAGPQELLGLALVLQIGSVELVERRPVNRKRQQSPVKGREDAMLVRPPFGERGQIVEHHFGIGVKDMRTVLVDQHAGIVVPVVSVATDMVAPIDKQHAIAAQARQPFGQNASGEPRTGDQPVKHVKIPAAIGCVRASCNLK